MKKTEGHFTTYWYKERNDYTMNLDISKFEGIIEILERDAGHKLMVSSQFNNLFVRSDTEIESDFMLRLSNKEFLTVARLSFVNKRQGYGTQVFEWLKKFARENEYEKIMFESVLTAEMKAFLEKKGFERLSPDSYNWVLSLGK